MLALEYQAAVNLVRKHHDVAIADDLGNIADVLLAQHSAGRILRRIQNDEPGAIADQRRQFVHIEAEIFLLAQADGHRPRPDVVNHRLVNREARVGEDDFISGVGQAPAERKENNWLAAGDDHHLVARDLHSRGNG